MLLRYFLNYRQKYDKLVFLIVALLIFFSVLSIAIPFLTWVVALLICSLFPIIVLNFFVLQYDFYKFFEEFSKQLDEIFKIE